MKVSESSHRPSRAGFPPFLIRQVNNDGTMNAERQVTAKYLAEMAGLNPELVRKYARDLRKMLASAAPEAKGSE